MKFIINFILKICYGFKFNIPVSKFINPPAFSLLELMFALVAISVMLAAFIPVITTKSASENPVVSSTGMLITSLECNEHFKNDYGLECTLCYGEESCVTCGGDCPPNMKKNVGKCSCE